MNDVKSIRSDVTPCKPPQKDDPNSGSVLLYAFKLAIIVILDLMAFVLVGYFAGMEAVAHTKNLIYVFILEVLAGSSAAYFVTKISRFIMNV